MLLGLVDPQERVLIVDPNHLGARVDLARAYFALGDSARARGEFRIALAQNPPPAASDPQNPLKKHHYNGNIPLFCK